MKIYLDNAATTRPTERVINAVSRALHDNWGNPSSVHEAGINSADKVKTARAEILSALGSRDRGDALIFTSGGTEANNLAVLGSIRAKPRPVRGDSRGTVIITDGEHSSIEKCTLWLENEGFTVKRISTVGGKIDFEALENAVSKDVVLAEFMLVNNETGAVYDVAKASSIVKSAAPQAVVHCDAVQAFMKIRFSPRVIGADTISVSAHKIHGPKGVGALYVSSKCIKEKRLSPIIYGGGQENGYRSGTENTSGIAGFCEAVIESRENFVACTERVRGLRALLISRVSGLNGTILNLPPEDSASPYILSVSIPGVKSETMLNYLSSEKGICVSAGSACASHGKKASAALIAFGVSKELADSTIRISFDYSNTEEDIEMLADALEEGIARFAVKKHR